MRHTAVSMALLIFSFLNGLRCTGAFDFNKSHTGVKFSPYLQAEVENKTLSKNFFKNHHLKVMLEIISTKFSRILIDDMDSWDVPYVNNETYYNDAKAAVKITEVAAGINKERGERFITVMIGIPLKESTTPQNADTILHVTLEAMEKAHTIFPGTVEGVYVTYMDMKGSTINNNQSLTWLRFLRDSTAELGVPVGTLQNCEDVLKGRNESDTRVMRPIFEEVFVNSNFIICHTFPSSQLAQKGAIHAFKGIRPHFLHQRYELESMNPKIQVMFLTFWPRLVEWYTKPTAIEFENCCEYWTLVDHFATENNLSFWMQGAFENPRNLNYIAWWYLKRHELILNESGYNEKCLGLSNNEPLRGVLSFGTTAKMPTLISETNVGMSKAPKVNEIQNFVHRMSAGRILLYIAAVIKFSITSAT